jgi:hypothetical protein
MTDVHIVDDATVHIEPGAILEFGPGARLVIGNSTTGGTLMANGTADAPIQFTGTSATPGAWNGIEFQPTANGARYNAQGDVIGGSYFRHCIIQYATQIRAMNSPGFECSTIRGCSGGGEAGAPVLLFAGPELLTQRLRDCAIRDNQGTGIAQQQPVEMDGCEISFNRRGISGGYHALTLRNCRIDSNTESGLAFAYGRLTLSSTEITRNSGYGLGIGSSSSWTITNCSVAFNSPYNLRYDIALSTGAFPGIWWGTTDRNLIETTILACQNEVRLGCGVTIDPILTTAPPTLTPGSCAP